MRAEAFCNRSRKRYCWRACRGEARTVDGPLRTQSSCGAGDGPTPSGYLAVTISWRWAFYINIPVGLLAVFLQSRWPEDPPYAKNAKPAGLDGIGFGLRAIWAACLQFVCRKGRRTIGSEPWRFDGLRYCFRSVSSRSWCATSRMKRPVSVGHRCRIGSGMPAASEFPRVTPLCRNLQSYRTETLRNFPGGELGLAAAITRIDAPDPTECRTVDRLASHLRANTASQGFRGLYQRISFALAIALGKNHA